MLQLTSQREREVSLTEPFCSMQALSESDEAPLHEGGQSALLSLPIQMLISSGITHPDTPRSHV